MLRVLIGIGLALCVGLGTAAAQDRAKKDAPKGEKVKKQLTTEEKAVMADKVFQKLDKNGDKKLSLDELKGKKTDPKQLETLERQFKAKDKNGDGVLSIEEFKAVPEKKAPGKKDGGKKEHFKKDAQK